MYALELELARVYICMPCRVSLFILALEFDSIFFAVIRNLLTFGSGLRHMFKPSHHHHVTSSPTWQLKIDWWTLRLLSFFHNNLLSSARHDASLTRHHGASEYFMCRKIRFPWRKCFMRKFAYLFYPWQYRLHPWRHLHTFRVTSISFAQRPG